jgi:hypothetical protein
LMAPSASTITRSVLESKAMSASLSLVISAATRIPSSFFWKLAIAAAIFFCALLAKGQDEKREALEVYCGPVLRHSAEPIQAANFRSAVAF